MPGAPQGVSRPVVSWQTAPPRLSAPLHIPRTSQRFFRFFAVQLFHYFGFIAVHRGFHASFWHGGAPYGTEVGQSAGVRFVKLPRCLANVICACQRRPRRCCGRHTPTVGASGATRGCLRAVSTWRSASTAPQRSAERSPRATRPPPFPSTNDNCGESCPAQPIEFGYVGERAVPPVRASRDARDPVCRSA